MLPPLSTISWTVTFLPLLTPPIHQRSSLLTVSCYIPLNIRNLYPPTSTGQHHIQLTQTPVSSLTVSLKRLLLAAQTLITLLPHTANMSARTAPPSLNPSSSFSNQFKTTLNSSCSSLFPCLFAATFSPHIMPLLFQATWASTKPCTAFASASSGHSAARMSPTGVYNALGYQFFSTLFLFISTLFQIH